jgi:hypothetical protein
MLGVTPGAGGQPAHDDLPRPAFGVLSGRQQPLENEDARPVSESGDRDIENLPRDLAEIECGAKPQANLPQQLPAGR